MAGLDARHMFFNDRTASRIHERIASLTTISTPPSGSPGADWALQHLPHLEKLLKDIGINIAGLHDLTTAACNRFNIAPEVIEFEASMQVPILTYAGRATFGDVLGILKPFLVLI